MRLYILTQRDPVFIDEFLRHTPFEMFSEVIILDAPNFGGGKLRGLKKFVQLFGFAGTINTIVKTLLNPSPKFKDNCSLVSKPWPDLMTLLRGADVSPEDLLLSLSAPHKVPTDVLGRFATRLNFHCGKLPEFAGMMPMFWQRLAGRDNYTITLHDLAADIDQGDIFFEVERPFSVDLLSSMIESKKVCAYIFFLFVSGKLKTVRETKHQATKGSFNKYPSREELSQFRRMRFAK